jgi:hypothetical protein
MESTGTLFGGFCIVGDPFRGVSKLGDTPGFGVSVESKPPEDGS